MFNSDTELMRRRLRLARGGLFLVFLLAPILSLLLLGVQKPYGRPFHRYPKIERTLTEADSRDQLKWAILEQSWVRRLSIAGLNNLRYYGFGYLDLTGFISGLDGWLFIKSDFWGGDCDIQRKFSRALANVAAVQDVAEAAGLRLLISVSPDKSTIYPEKLHPRARAIWRCKAQSGLAWRQLAQGKHARIVDHAEPLLRARRDDPEARFFYVTDTHWTPLGAAWAWRQWVSVLGNLDIGELPPPRLNGKVIKKKTDMGSALLIGEPDLLEMLDPAPEKELAQIANARVHLGNVLILHDSFYGIDRGGIL